MGRFGGRHDSCGATGQRNRIRPTPVRPGGNGGPGRGRTADTAIFSRVLYQLSYRATGEAGDYRTWRARRGAVLGIPGVANGLLKLPSGCSVGQGRSGLGGSRAGR